MDGCARVGCVAIGRNEGERLERCLRTLIGRVGALVYVDSASTDGSVSLARSLGVEVVELDASVPFSAARARNAGFERLLSIAPEASLVQFVDGDCEIEADWIPSAVAAFDEAPDAAAVWGVRYERFSQRTVYNRLCDIEWRSGTFGDVDSFGGDVMIRASALAAAGGYDPAVIAAEDQELAVRLRLAGFRILRLDRKMTTHDAAMDRLAQWWRRATRCGHGYAQVSALHGRSVMRKFVRERRRVLLFGAGLPAVAIGLAPFTLGASLALLAFYPLQALRIAHASHRAGLPLGDAAAWGVSCAFSKLPEVVGLFRYHLDRVRRRAPRIIEYKSPAWP